MSTSEQPQQIATVAFDYISQRWIVVTKAGVLCFCDSRKKAETVAGMVNAAAPAQSTPLPRQRCDCPACVETRARHDAGWTSFEPLRCDKAPAGPTHDRDELLNGLKLVEDAAYIDSDGGIEMDAGKMLVALREVDALIRRAEAAKSD